MIPLRAATRASWAATWSGPQPWLLAAPFAAAVVVLDGLTRAIATFHGTDESVYHVPIVRQFADDLPMPDLTNYRASMTPLFHVVFAVASRLVGMELWRLRLLNAGLSLLAVLVLYRLLVRRGHGPWPAFGVALLFAVSPYFFGTSFLLLTDSLGMLLVLLSLAALDRFASAPGARMFGFACLAVCGAVMTRQNAVWLAGVALLVVLAAPVRPRAKAAAVAAVACALAPFAALAAAWGDFVPKGSPSGPCAVCTNASAVSGLNARALLFALAVLAVYGVALLGPQLLRERSRLPRAAPLGAALAGAAALVAVPLARRGELDAGWLWQVSARGPEIAGTSWLFWLLVPAGTALVVALVARARDREGRLDMVAAGTAICFLASTLAIGFVYQKYVDPFALVIVALAARPGDFARPAYAGAVVLGVAFVLYAATFRAERNRPDAVARAEPATLAPAAAASFGGAALGSRSDG